jgi:glycerol-3-phosphate acyltransferase PlsY
MNYILLILLGYLLGCSSMAWYLAKAARADLRGNGTGNLGASNTVVLLGWKAGVLTALHDIGKASLAVLLARWLLPGVEHGGAVAGVACVLGHIFPFWLKFRGGKGFASYFGVALALNWKMALVVALAVILVTLITDYIVCGTLTPIISVPLYMGFTRSWLLALILFVGTAVIIYKHRENFPRMLNGTELGLRSAIRGDNRIR